MAIIGTFNSKDGEFLSRLLHMKKTIVQQNFDLCLTGLISANSGFVGLLIYLEGIDAMEIISLQKELLSITSKIQTLRSIHSEKTNSPH